MTEKKSEEKTPPPAAGMVRVKIWTDGVFSSLGEHRKGAIVDIPEEDAKILIDGEHAQKC